MPASIVLTGLPTNYPNPGTFVELQFAQGPVAGSGAPRSVLLVGNKTTAGTATVDTVVYGANTQTPCQTETDVINLFGPGSQLHRMFLRFMQAAGPNNTTPLYFLAVAPSAGAAATTTQVLATTALTNGNCRVWCGQEFVDTAISTGDTATVIGANVAASVNSQTRWPVTANSVTGTITYTAKNLGPEGNWIRMQAMITPATGSIGTTTTLTANTFLSGGTTPDVNTTALTTIASARYYYIAIADSDATNAGRVVAQAVAQALPTKGIRQRVIFGSMDTLANTITLATGINAPRAECIWGSATDLTPAELAATAAGIYSTLEQGAQAGVARKNFSLFPTGPADAAYWPVLAGRAGVAGAPTPIQVTSALNNGITPITVLATGAAQLVKRCTTYSLSGSTADYRIRDGHKVSVCDYWCDDAQAITQLQFGGKDLLPDVIVGQPPPGPQAVTPKRWGGALKALVNAYGQAGQWTYPPNVTPAQNQTPADTINANMVGPQIEAGNTNRMSVLVGLSPVGIFDQAALLAQQIA